MQIDQLKKLFNDHNLLPKKSKGQNFLIDESYIDQMLAAAQVSDKDLVVEIGSGFGVLTKAMIKRVKRVLAIELDAKLADYLRTTLLKEHKNLDLIEGDALSNEVFHQMVAWLYKQQVPDAVIDPRDDSYQEILESVDHSYKLIANLPYQITSKVLRQFLESLPRPGRLVVMVQKEVAERMTAPPGKMSLLSLATQVYSQAEIVAVVPSEAFYPIPEVESAIVHCNLNEPNLAFQELEPQQKKMFWRLARAGFSSRRKQLQNNLKVFNLDFQKTGISPTARAQELGVEEWCKLAKI